MRKPREWLYPSHIERKYQRQLRNLVREIYAEYVRRLKAATAHRIDADEDDWSDEVSGVTAALVAWWLMRRTTVQTATHAIFVGMNAFNDAQFVKMVKDVFGITLANSSTVYAPPTMVTAINQVVKILGPDADINRIEPFIENVRKVFEDKAIVADDFAARKLITELELIVRTEVPKGTAANKIIEELENKAESAERQIVLRARDDLAKLNAQLTQERFKSIGRREYVWKDCREERVRGNPGGKYPKAIPSHWARNDKVFRWSDPPEGGHPGEAWLCRCTAQMVPNKIT